MADGQILFGEGGPGAGTLSTGALTAVAATTDIMVQAGLSITFSDIGTLNLATGVGNQVTFSTNTTGGGVISFLATSNSLVTNGASIAFEAGTGLILANLNANGGDVGLAAGTQGMGNLSAQSILNAGNLTLLATNVAGGTITQAGTASAANAAFVQAQGNITVDSLRGTPANVTSNTGSITSAGLNPIQVGGQLSLTAVTGINVRTRAQQLTAYNSTSGDLSITQSSGPAQALSTVGSGVLNDSGGHVSVTNQGSGITLNAPVGAVAAGNVTLNAQVGALTLNNVAVATGTGNISPSAADNVTLSDTNADVTTGGAGAITINADGNADNAGLFSSDIFGSAVTTAGGNITITAADVALVGTVNSGAGVTTIQNYVVGRAINLGTNAAGSLGLTAGELNLAGRGYDRGQLRFYRFERFHHRHGGRPGRHQRRRGARDADGRRRGHAECRRGRRR